MGIGVTSHSSSIEDLQADRVRRRAERDGLKRSHQPPEPGTRVTSDLPSPPLSTGRTQPSTQGSPEVLTSNLAKKIRVYQLARELGLTNKEGLDLCLAMGIGVTSNSSSIEHEQADRVRRKAERDGLKRSHLGQPQPPTPDSPATHPAPARRPVHISKEAIARRGGGTTAGDSSTGLPPDGPARVFIDGRCSACGRIFDGGVERAAFRFVSHECGGHGANDEWRFDR